MRLTNPALGGNRYNAVPRAPHLGAPAQAGNDQEDENAVTRVIPSMPLDPDATMVRPIAAEIPDRGMGGGRPGPAARADAEATQVIPVTGPGPAAGHPGPRTGDGAPAGRDDEQWVPARQRPQTPSRPQPRSAASRAQYEDPTLPPTWFRDPEAEHTQAMRSPVPPQQPVFTPPPTPVSPPEPPSPHGREPRDRRWVVVIVLVLILTFLVIGIVVWWMLGGSMTKEAGPALHGSPTSSSSLVGGPQTGGPTDAGRPSTGAPSSTASSPGAAASLPASAKRCSGSVGAGGATSCGFARNVAAAIPADGDTDVAVRATSPVTGKSYEMTCRDGAVVVCRGGNNAEVYVIR